MIAYLILLAAVALPALDAMSSLWPAQYASLTWRYTALSLIASSVGAPLVLLLFGYLIATLAGDRPVLIALLVFSVLLVVIIVAGSTLFLLDYVQLRGRLQVDTLSRFDAATSLSALKYLVNGILYVLLGVSILRTHRQIQPAYDVAGPYFVKAVGTKGAD